MEELNKNYTNFRFGYAIVGGGRIRYRKIGIFFLHKLGIFGTLKLAFALQFIVTNAYFSVARTLTLVLHATLK